MKQITKEHLFALAEDDELKTNSSDNFCCYFSISFYITMFLVFLLCYSLKCVSFTDFSIGATICYMEEPHKSLESAIG